MIIYPTFQTTSLYSPKTLVQYVHSEHPLQAQNITPRMSQSLTIIQTYKPPTLETITGILLLWNWQKAYNKWAIN